MSASRPVIRIERLTKTFGPMAVVNRGGERRLPIMYDCSAAARWWPVVSTGNSLTGVVPRPP